MAFGFQAASAAPVPAADSFAIRLRDCPPIDEKSPPAYTSPPDTANADTLLSAFGFQVASAAPVPAADSFAMKLRDCPPIDEKSPPAYTAPPDTANARHAAVGAGVPGGVEAAVGMDVRQAVARHALGRREVAADKPAAGPIGRHRADRTVEVRKREVGLIAAGGQLRRPPRTRPHARKRSAQIRAAEIVDRDRVDGSRW